MRPGRCLRASFHSHVFYIIMRKKIKGAKDSEFNIFIIISPNIFSFSIFFFFFNRISIYLFSPWWVSHQSSRTIISIIVDQKIIARQSETYTVWVGSPPACPSPRHPSNRRPTSFSLKLFCLYPLWMPEKSGHVTTNQMLPRVHYSTSAFFKSMWQTFRGKPPPNCRCSSRGSRFYFTFPPGNEKNKIKNK